MKLLFFQDSKRSQIGLGDLAFAGEQGYFASSYGSAQIIWRTMTMQHRSRKEAFSWCRSNYLQRRAVVCYTCPAFGTE